jgi:hypothetical protein
MNVIKEMTEWHAHPINPVGSRSVSAKMGFAQPYDVDAAGMRAAFQLRLIVEKLLWEEEHDCFITDRSASDNLAYSMMHCQEVGTLKGYRDLVQKTNDRYDVIFFLPIDSFIKLGGDPARKDDLEYHRYYEGILRGTFTASMPIVTVSARNCEERKDFVRQTMRDFKRRGLF